MEPEWKYAGQILYKNGAVRSLRYFALDLNSDASSKIAQDKHFTKFFLKKSGYPTAEGQTIFEDKWAESIKSNRRIAYAIKYAKRLGYPVIAKPNSKNQGENVFLVYNRKELKKALLEIFKEDKVAIVERYLPGRDYRVVVLDGEVISAYERAPLSVVGDGKHSVIQLLRMKQKFFRARGRGTEIDFKDTRIKTKLRRKNYAFSSVPSRGEKVFLLDNANLSTGGDSVDVTDSIHKGFKKIAAQITKNMGLRLCGVDIMVTKGDITQDSKTCSYYVIEINSVPGLNNYANIGMKQRKIVEAMYLKILKKLGGKN